MSGRPEHSEAAPYYFRYIDRISDDDIVRVINNQFSLFENMPLEGWTRGGVASDNYVSVRALAYIIAGHLSHHVAMLRDRYW